MWFLSKKISQTLPEVKNMGQLIGSPRNVVKHEQYFNSQRGFSVSIIFAKFESWSKMLFLLSNKLPSKECFKVVQHNLLRVKDWKMGLTWLLSDFISKHGSSSWVIFVIFFCSILNFEWFIQDLKLNLRYFKG